MKKIIAIAVVILLVGIVAYRGYVNFRNKKEAMSMKPVEKVVPVRTVTPQRMEIVDKIRASGSIQAEIEVMIFSKVSGKIARNLVNIGSPVKKDAVVAIINRDEVGYQFNPYEVVSDVKGVVSRVLLNPGASVNPATPIFAIVDVDQVKAVVAVDELKIRFVKLGMAVRLYLQAYPDESFSARVTAISPICNPQTRAIDVEITIPNPGYRIKPGMYAEMEMVQGSRNSLVLPVVAVVDRGGQKFVFTPEGGRARMVPVVTGVVIGDTIEIVSGLQGGETVIASGADRLDEGDRVNVVGG